MFFPEGQIRIHVYGCPVDMRKSYNGLYALTREGLRQDPLSGSLFVFISKRATQMKVLYFDRSGFCIWGKRLEAGKFVSDWSQVHTREMDWTELKLLLEGIEPGRRRKRYRLTNEVKKSAVNTSSNIGDALPSHHASGIDAHAPERDRDSPSQPSAVDRDRALASGDYRGAAASPGVV
jgi:transposase